MQTDAEPLLHLFPVAACDHAHRPQAQARLTVILSAAKDLSVRRDRHFPFAALRTSAHYAQGDKHSLQTSVVWASWFTSDVFECMIHRAMTNIQFQGGLTMVAQREPQHMTVDEWRELERISHDIKHEYIDGQVYAMPGGSLAHGRIGSNTVRTLEDALTTAGNPCDVYNSDVAVRLSPRRYTYPDASVTCDERDRSASDKTDVQAPCVIVEVLSDSTEAYDRGRKFGLYRACPTVQEYVLVATRYQAVEVYRRTLQGWAIYQSYGPGDEIELTSLGVRFPLASLYKNAGVLEAIEDLEGEV